MGRMGLDNLARRVRVFAVSAFLLVWDDDALAKKERLREPLIRPSLILAAEKGYGNACMGRGLFWTALHVIEGDNGGSPITGWRTGPFFGGAVQVLGRDKDHDLAWGIATGDFVPSSVLISKEMPVAGERLWAQALLWQDWQTIRLPHYAFLVEDDGLLYTDGLSWPGMSGACLLNEQGELVAINLGTTVPKSPASMLLPASRWAVVVGR